MENCVHVYLHTWVPSHGEDLVVVGSMVNRTGLFAVAVKKDEDIVGHIPRWFSFYS